MKCMVDINESDIYSAFKKLGEIELALFTPVLIYCVFNINPKTLGIILGLLFIVLITLVIFAIYLLLYGD